MRRGAIHVDSPSIVPAVALVHLQGPVHVQVAGDEDSATKAMAHVAAVCHAELRARGHSAGALHVDAGVLQLHAALHRELPGEGHGSEEADGLLQQQLGASDGSRRRLFVA